MGRAEPIARVGRTPTATTGTPRVSRAAVVACLGTVPDLEALAVGGGVLTVAEVLSHPAAAPIASRWAARVEALTAADPARPDRDAIRGAARAFRYARGLLAAEDLEAWLATVGLTSAQWRDALARSLDLDAGTAGIGAAGQTLETIAWPSAVCDGFAAEALDVVARATAVASAEGLHLHADVSAAVAAFEARAADAAAVEVEVRTNAADWIAVEATWLRLRTEDAAREARLCLAHDLRTPAEVGRLAEVEPEHGAWYLRDAPPDLRDLALSTPPGAVAGPARADGGHVVALIERRVPPDVADPEVASAVAVELAERAIRRVVEERTRRLLPLG